MKNYNSAGKKALEILQRGESPHGRATIIPKTYLYSKKARYEDKLYSSVGTKALEHITTWRGAA